MNRKMAQRKLFIQDAWRVQARTSAEEMAMVAKSVAEKLNQYQNKNLVKFVIPQKAFSSLSVEGEPFMIQQRIRHSFIGELRRHLDPEIETLEVNADINSPEFAHAVVEVFRRLHAATDTKS